jgi:hypothetical protein
MSMKRGYLTGRKSKLTPDLMSKAENLLRAGNYVCVVVDYLNIGKSTWYDWIKQGEKASRGIYRDFYDMVQKAEAVAEVAAVSGIIATGKTGNWQALAWMLERKHPDRWGKREKITQELTGKDGGAVEIKSGVDLSKYTEEELMILAQLVSKGSAGTGDRGEAADVGGNQRLSETIRGRTH